MVGACSLLAGLYGCGGTEQPTLVAEAPPPRGHSRIAEERPPHPQPPYDVAPKPKRSGPAPPPGYGAAPAPSNEAADPSSLPPASAGTNGSYDPAAAGEREGVTPRTMEELARQTESKSAVLLNGVALAPPSAP